MKKKTMVGISIMISAFAFGLNMVGISPVLGILNEKYSSYGTSTVQLLQTVQYLLIIVGSLMLGWLTTKISKKKIVMLGLLIIGICGTIPFFIDNFMILLLLRFLIGFGFGIMGPMNTAIITEFVEPEERAPFMGLHVVGMGLGTMICNLLGGVFAGMGYRYFFLVYVIAFAAMAAIWFTLKETPPVTNEKSSDMKMNKIVYGLCFASFAHTLFINAYSTNIGIYILKNITDNPSVTGIVTASNAAFALLVGLTFGKIAGFLKNFTLPFSLFAAAVGYGTLLIVPGMAGVYIASALCGVSLSCFMAMASLVLSISVKKEAVAKASGVFSIVGSIGGFIAPVVLGGGARMLGENSAKNQFIVAFIGMLIFAVIVTFITMKPKKEEK